MKLYLDESGNTGDAVLEEDKEPFGGQPVFALASVGVMEEGIPSLEAKVEELKEEHHVQMPELKGSKLFKSKPAFVRDVVFYVLEREYPVMAEVMDKQYFLASNVSQYFLLGPQIRAGVFADFVAGRLRPLAHLLAETTFEFLSDDALAAYSRACRSREPSDLYYFMRIFALECIPRYRNKLEHGEEQEARMLGTMAKHAKMSTAVFEEFRRERQSGRHDLSDEDLVSDFLPMPDRNKREEILAMLPHSAAFSNLMLRVNALASSRNIETVEVTHDEQAHFDEVLTGYHDILNSGTLDCFDVHVEDGSAPYRDKIRYGFEGNRTLSFATSDATVGVQIADVLAGTCRLAFEQKALGGLAAVSEPIEEVLDRLLSLSNRETPEGINVVSTLQRSRDSFYPGAPEDTLW